MRRFCCVFCLDITFLPPGCKTLLSSLFFLFFSFQSFAFHSPLTCAVANSSNYDLTFHGIRTTANPATSAAISYGNVTYFFKAAVSNIHAAACSVWFIHNQIHINTHLPNTRDLISIIVKPKSK